MNKLKSIIAILLLGLIVISFKAKAQTWDSVGTGMNGTVNVLTVDTVNNILYAGGEFTTAGGVSANYIAKWDGISWDSVGSGMNNAVRALTIYNDTLYAGGWFTTAGGVGANYIAKWNGISWSNLETSEDLTNISAGTYTVTVTDENFCTATASVTITEPQLLTANISSITDVTCSGENDGSIDITVSGGTPGYTFSWTGPDGFTSLDEDIFDLFEGIYDVTVTDVNGCTATASASVHTIIILFPFSSFTYTPTDIDICMDETIIFTNNSTGSGVLEYLWDFGDGTTSTEFEYPHSYSSPGYYQVVLTVTDMCGQYHSSCQFVNITPSISGVYNDNCCSKNAYYDEDDVDIPFNTTQNWSGPGTMIIRGTLTIEEKATLTISDNFIVKFGPNGKIIVERGATLIVTTGAELNGLSQCNTMWQGIEVWGNSAEPSNSPEQGKIIINDGGRILNAHVGVLLGRTHLCCALPPPYCPEPPCLISICMASPYYHNYGGGIIEADDNAEFGNNAVSIMFTPYLNDINVSYIRNSTFYGDNILDPGYTIGNSYEYSNEANPFYADATDDGIANVFAYLWRVRKVKFYGNNFDIAETGIESHNSWSIVGSIFEVNIFNNLIYGFRAFNTTNSLNSAQFIIGNIFRNIEIAGIWNTSGIGGEIKENIFINFNPLQSDYNTGIWLENSSGFLITDNEFEYLANGIVCLNSGEFGGSISAEDYSILNHLGNEFTLCNIGIFTILDNSQLQLRCNTHNNPDADFYSLNWSNWLGPLHDQGKFDPVDPYNDQNPAGNEFDPFNPSPIKDIETFGFYLPPWVNIPPSPYIYYRHHKGGLWFMNPDAVIPVTSTPIDIIDVSDYAGIDINKTETSCVPCPISITPQFINDKNNEIAELKTEYANVESSLDGYGNTQALLDAINSNILNGKLKNMLLNNSPLSDTVIIEIIERPNPLPPGHFKRVMLPNSPVSDKVRPYLDNKLEELPPGIANQIRYVQVYNPSYRTLTAISREIETAKLERQLAFNSIINDKLIGDSIDFAVSMLEAENTVEANQVLAGTFLLSNNLTEAQNKLNSLPGNTQEEQDWIDLQNILLQLAVDTITVFDIDSTQEQFIRSLAYQIPESPATSNAKSILRLVYGEDFPIQLPPYGDNFKMMQANDEQNETDNISDDKEHIYLGKNYPDPFDNYTNIPYYVPDETSNVFINVYDLIGNFIKKYQLSKGDNTLIIKTSDWPNGAYFYCIEIDGAILEYDKMLKIN